MGLRPTNFLIRNISSHIQAKISEDSYLRAIESKNLGNIVIRLFIFRTFLGKRLLENNIMFDPWHLIPTNPGRGRSDAVDVGFWPYRACTHYLDHLQEGGGCGVGGFPLAGRHWVSALPSWLQDCGRNQS